MLWLLRRRGHVVSAIEVRLGFGIAALPVEVDGEGGWWCDVRLDFGQLVVR